MNIPESNKRFKEFRKSTGKTQLEFGDSLGVGQAAISEIENGRNEVSTQMLSALERVYGVSPAWITIGKLPKLIKKTEAVNFTEALNKMTMGEIIQVLRALLDELERRK